MAMKSTTVQDCDQEADFARGVLKAEAAASVHVAINEALHDAVDRVIQVSGSVVVTGLGKSYLIGQKIRSQIL